MTQRPPGPGSELDTETALAAPLGLAALVDTELPLHVRAFAAAHAAGGPVPPAPAGLSSAAVVMYAMAADPTLARICVPLAIESAHEIVDAREEAGRGGWDAYADLRSARDEVSRRKFGAAHLEILDAIHGVTARAESSPTAEWPARLGAWHAPQGTPAASLDDVWRAFGAPAGLRLVNSTVAHPRAFVVRPRAEVIVVARLDARSPCDRFEVLHELGHALAALIAEPVPRVVDEAVAAYVARHQEIDGVLPAGWASPVAAAARERRIEVARRLDVIERARLVEAVPAALPKAPWALVHDPGAQAVYVAAQPIADRWWAELGQLPSLAVLAAAITAEHARLGALG